MTADISVSARLAVDHLRSEDPACDVTLRGEIGDVAIRTAVPLDAPERDGLTWLSPKFFARNPQIVRDVRVAMLVAPMSLAPEDAPHVSILLRTERPKRLFAKALEFCFGDQLQPTWLTPAELDGLRGQCDIGPGVQIARGVSLADAVRIGPNTVIANTSIGPNTSVGANCTIGLPGFGYERDDDGSWFRMPHIGRVAIDRDVEIGSNTCIDRGTLGATSIAAGVKIDNLVHIAHNVVIGARSLIIANAMLGGSARIGADCWVAPSVSVLNQLSIGDNAVIGMGAVVIRNVDPSATIVGNPGKPLSK